MATIKSRRIGQTAAAVEYLRSTPDSAMLARDNVATRSMAKHHDLDVELVLHNDKPTGNVLLRSKGAT